MILDLKFHLTMAVRNDPFVMSLISRRDERPWNQRRVLRPTDDALIDGFPRSANTFATYAFDASQPKRLKVGNHLHSPAQFKVAARNNIPSMLVIRDPVPSIVSYMMFRPDIGARSGLMRYIAFHKPLHRIRESFVIAPFEEVISDFAISVDRMNERFGTQFARFKHTPESAKAILEKIDVDYKKRLEIENSALPVPKMTKEQARDMLEGSALQGLRDDAREQFHLIRGF